MTPMERLADEIRQASVNYFKEPTDLNRVYLNGLLMAQAIFNDEID